MGLGPGTFTMGFVLPSGEVKKSARIESGKWYFDPLLLMGGKVMTAADSTRYITRMNRVNAGLVTVEVNDSTVLSDVDPVIQSGRTLLPVRAVTEAMGASVNWDAATRKATITLGATTVVLEPGNKTAIVKGVPVQMDVPATIISDRILVPVRFVGESFGYNVLWDAAWRTATLRK
jgi:hypothetical protein